LVSAQWLSRFLSYLLRHRPAEYPLAFDRFGFVDLGRVLAVVHGRFPDATEQDVIALIEGGEKKRFELRDAKVRAT
jgi:putative RNA 2'-phosphotransferase